MDLRDPLDRCDGSAALGGLAWVGVVSVTDVDLVSAVVLFGVLALVPLALPLAATPRRDGSHARTFRWATAAQPVGAALFAGSTLVVATRGTTSVAAALALPWVIVTLLLAWFGVWRLRGRGLRPVEEAVLDVGLLTLPVGALAAVAWRLDLGLGYGLSIVHLTAAHFHYATFLLPVVVAALGRYLRHHRVYRWAAGAVVVSMPFVALGITVSPVLEAVAAPVFAGGVVAVAAMFVRVAGEVSGGDQGAAALLVVAGISAGLAMALAVSYALGPWVGGRAPTVADMVPTHGLLNAFGFSLPAVLAWRRLNPPPRASPPERVREGE